MASGYNISMNVIDPMGSNVNGNVAGIHVGILTETAPPICLVGGTAGPCLCITEDASTYVNETTPANEATDDDVELVGATIAADDAIYFGSATQTFTGVDIMVGVVGSYTTTTFQWEYWDGDSWTAVSGLTEGDWETGGDVDTVESVTWTLPTDWAKVPVDNVYGYWVRARCTATGGTTTQAQFDQIWLTGSASSQIWTDATTDIGDAGDDDVLVVSAQGAVGDAIYFGHASEKFCKIKIDLGTALVATLTHVWQYWDGSAWTALTTVEDGTASSGAAFEITAADDLIVGFVPPTDWTLTTTTNGPGATPTAGYFVRCAVTAFTSVTTPATLDQGYLYPFTTGATGHYVGGTGTINRVSMHAVTNAGAANDSIFVLINKTQNLASSFTWTQGVLADTDTSISLAVASGDELILVQVQEDGTAEIDDADFNFTVVT